MSRSRLRRPSPALALAIVAVVLSTTGSAVAASLITSKQITDGTIQTKDLSPKVRKALKSQRGVAGPAGPTGGTGATGAPGLTGANGTARAYGAVSRSGTLSATIRKNVTAVDVPFSGTYCITLDPSVDATLVRAVATLDYANSDSNAIISTIAAGGTSCPGNSLDIETDTLTSITGTGNSTASNQGFFFIVP